MFRTKKWMVVPVLAVVLAFATDTRQAKAQDCGFGFGGGYSNGYG
jgi:hypothetical protein